MRVVLLFLLAILCACTQKEKVISDLSGDWVNLNYVQSIRMTKSPKASQGKGAFSFVSFKGDTALFILGFHEGYSLTVNACGRNTFYCCDLDGDTIRMVVSGDTMMIKKKENQERYIKYKMSSSNTWFDNLLLNKEIFSGKYRDVDSPSHTVVFNDDGGISGFQDYTSYVVQSDYFDEGCDYDIIYLRKKVADRFKYTWSFSGDTLLIYNLDCSSYDPVNKLCAEIKRGRILYRLLKK